VNGKPAKGLFVTRGTHVMLSPNAAPGTAIADGERGGMGHWHFEILQDDGKPIGTLVALGLTGGERLPGGPLHSAQHAMAIVGGTGAFLGARGQAGRPRSRSRDPPCFTLTSRRWSQSRGMAGAGGYLSG
jgi:hypothetical protein